jgi:predicted ester cyclase
MNDSHLDANKSAVRRFNEAFITGGDERAFQELVADDFVNRTALPGVDPGREGMLQTFQNVLRKAFPDLSVTIHDQVAEGDRVVTRKTLRGTHRGPLMDVAPTGRVVEISVIDIVRLRGGRYVEHWGINSLASVLAELRGR